MSAPPPAPIATAIAAELSLDHGAVTRTLALFADGGTVPFVARYRKEATGGLDEVQLAKILERRDYRLELEDRRGAILKSIEEQGKLTDALRARITAADSKTDLEDLYLPYKPKRRTRAMIARERGLEPLGDAIWSQSATFTLDPAKFLDEHVPDVDAAWAGARDIVAERVAEDANLRADLRAQALAEGQLAARQTTRHGKQDEPAPDDVRKFQDYFDFAEPVRTLPSHRVLALLRGEALGILRVTLELDLDAALAHVRRRTVRPGAHATLAAQLDEAMTDAYQRLLAPSIEVDTRKTLKERADVEAIRVFASNLSNLLLAPPLGGKRVLALDPGFRTGCKVVVIDAQGNLKEHTVVYLHQEDNARRTLVALAKKYDIEAIAVGNGTAGRETEALCRSIKTELPANVMIVAVNESGASIYSASEVAREELGEHDLTVRGAVSIGRRLQDPLAELVKIDAKSIGVGQYQHDVDQPALKRALDSVVENAVNQVGVEVNTASAKLSAYVAGIGETLARNIVAYRSEHGPFQRRKDIRDVPRLGAKAFEQAAGFLRIRGGADPLDASAVHPESYDVVARMAADLGVAPRDLVGQAALVAKIKPAAYIDERRGEPTLRDIVAELEKPGRDPRRGFEATGFRDDVTEIDHLQEGMILAGVVTNVTAFGAFVDIGVHQDGLVHVSELAHKFVKDPAEVVKVGDPVKVKVLRVEKDRKRIALSIKQTSAPPVAAPRPPSQPPQQQQRSAPRPPPPQQRQPQPPQPPPKPFNTPFNSIRIRPPK